MCRFYLVIPRFLCYWWKRVQAVFIDAEEEDEAFQEPYHPKIHPQIRLLGRRRARILFYAWGVRFAVVYVAVSTLLRICFVAVRVKPRGEDSGAYELNFYLDEDDDGIADERRTKTSKKFAALVPKVIKRKASDLMSHTGTAMGLKRQPSTAAKSSGGKDQNDGAYTFADAKPDAFGVGPEDLDEDHEPPTKSESKGAKRLKKAMNKKSSFIIDPEIYNDPNSVTNSGGKRTINKSPSTKFTAKLSFKVDSPTSPNNPGAVISQRPSSDGEKSGASGTNRQLSSPKTSFSFNDGRTAGKNISPKTSFNMNDGSAAQGAQSNKSSFTSNDGNTAKMAPKLSFSGLDSFLNLVPIVGKGQAHTPPVTGEAHDREMPFTPPGSARESDRGHERHDHEHHGHGHGHGHEHHPRMVAGGMRAVALANKLMHKVKLNRLKKGHKGHGAPEAGDGSAAHHAAAAAAALNESSDYESPGDEGLSSREHDHHHDAKLMGIDLNPLSMFKGHKKRAKTESFHLPEDDDERKPHPGRERSVSGAKRSHSKRLSKTHRAGGESVSRSSQLGGYISSDSDTRDDEVDGEGYRMVEELGSDDSDDPDRLEGEGGLVAGDGAEEEVMTPIKQNVLFTPDDIIRMFPANENEMAKLEIEDEIRKLKVSSEAAVAAATEEMKADFKVKLSHAVTEIRALKDAVLSSRLDRLGDGKGANGDSAPSTARGASPALGGAGVGAGKVHKAGSFSQGDGARVRTSSHSPFAHSKSEYCGTMSDSTAAAGGFPPISPRVDSPPSAQHVPIVAPQPTPVPQQAPALSPHRMGTVQTLIQTFDTSRAAPTATYSAPAPSGYPTYATVPTAVPTASAAAVAPSASAQEVEQMQQELQDLKGDMKDIKKLLGTILVKMSK
jgi:hypothetical protein